MSDPFFDFVFDLIEEGEFLLLEVALPGILETEIDITLEGSRILIRAQLSDEERPLFEKLRAAETRS